MSLFIATHFLVAIHICKMRQSTRRRPSYFGVGARSDIICGISQPILDGELYVVLCFRCSRCANAIEAVNARYCVGSARNRE